MKNLLIEIAITTVLIVVLRLVCIMTNLKMCEITMGIVCMMLACDLIERRK